MKRGVLVEKNMALNINQHKLVETHIDVVEWIIKRKIMLNDGIVGLSYDDVFGEGCYWLCKAALTYDGSVKFKTYAKTVVLHGLISYCRKTFERYKKTPLFHLGDSDVSEFNKVLDESNCYIDKIEIIDFLQSVKLSYNGTARLGIEALKLRIEGYTVTEISDFYSVAPNLVGAWISRAVQKLRKDSHFIAEIAC